MEPLRSLIHVGVVMAISGSLTPAQMTELRAEAARLWQPYGVHLSWFDADDDCSSTPIEDWAGPIDLLVRVSTDDGERRSVRGNGSRFPPLGSVSFEAGIPERRVHLLYWSVARIVLESRIAGWAVAALPPFLRDQFVGRALGRVLAHELGHVLLGAPAHANNGLMRANMTANDLIAIGNGHLRLNRSFVGRLERRIHDTRVAGTAESALRR